MASSERKKSPDQNRISVTDAIANINNWLDKDEDNDVYSSSDEDILSESEEEVLAGNESIISENFNVENSNSGKLDFQIISPEVFNSNVLLLY